MLPSASKERARQPAQRAPADLRSLSTQIILDCGVEEVVCVCSDESEHIVIQKYSELAFISKLSCEVFKSLLQYSEVILLLY